ncbi:hypothetical protein QO209_21070 [Pseudomonas citronellolis]|uniref:hypothetical protein n=1 Tax=Pseudomonas citronellolis TaxID=53408 RepID=UPI002648CE5B|nr:hypothetical protein [Pseudomonas citronellolis]MDN6874942.1 hypothetical protein [Pseudomonas citronellolis]
MIRWLGVGLLAVIVSIGAFVLAASGRVPELSDLNIWMLAATPILLWVLAFGVRAYSFGGAVSHFQFLEDEAIEAESAWNEWARRNIAVQASCLVLPELISAPVIAQGAPGVSPCSGVAKRITSLPAKSSDRIQAGLDQLLVGVGPAVAAIPVEQTLRVTLLSDVAPDNFDLLLSAWRKRWPMAAPSHISISPSLVNELSFDWVERSLKSPGADIDLILVLQINGQSGYSDGLAALLVCLDALAIAQELTVQGRLLRPMPLETGQLETELPLFLQTQVEARSATGILADSVQWKDSLGTILSMGSAQGAKLQVGSQWIQESLSGLPGPFSHWLVAALGLDLARHRKQPLLLLSQERSQRWISTIATGESA